MSSTRFPIKVCRYNLPLKLLKLLLSQEYHIYFAYQIPLQLNYVLYDITTKHARTHAGTHTSLNPQCQNALPLTFKAVTPKVLMFILLVCGVYVLINDIKSQSHNRR